MSKEKKNDEIHKILIEQLISYFEKGNTFKYDWAKREEKGILNFSTGKKYSGSNILFLLISQKLNLFEYSLWSGLNQTKMKLRKGSKATRIILPIEKRYKVIDKSGEVILDHTGNPVYSKSIYYRFGYVFNIMQFEECPQRDVILEKYTSVQNQNFDSKIENHEPIEEIINKYLKDEGVSLVFGGNSAYYDLLTDAVHIPEKENFRSTSGYYSTLIHELLHSTGAINRCDRHKSGLKAYALEELIVELGSVIICHEQNINSIDSLQNSAAYLEHWIEILKEDKDKILFTILKQSNQAVRYLISGKKC